MNVRHLPFILISCLVISCTNQVNNTESKVSSSQASFQENTPKVTGIGGIFFKSENPSELKKWYSENLGMEVDDYGSAFEFRNANRPEETNYLNWDAFVDSTKYFEPSEKQFMINYRVQNIDALVENLRENGVTIVDTIASYSYGKFVHIMDSDGNKLELWEPIDSVLGTIGRKTNK